MKNLGILIAVLMTASSAFAGTELVCGAKGKVNGIMEIHAQDSFPEQQYCAISTIDSPAPRVEVKFCSNGSIDDSSVLIASATQTGIGTTQVKLEKAGDVYTLVKTFDCDWINGEEHCGMNSPTEILAKEIVDCMMVRE